MTVAELAFFKRGPGSRGEPGRENEEVRPQVFSMASGNGDGAVHYMWDDNPEAAQLQQQFGVDSQGRTVHNFPGVPAEALIEGPHASMAMFSLQLLLGCMWFMKTLCSPDQHFTDAGIMQEELPGYDPEEVLAKPHRELTFQECEMYAFQRI